MGDGTRGPCGNLDIGKPMGASIPNPIQDYGRAACAAPRAQMAARRFQAPDSKAVIPPRWHRRRSAPPESLRAASPHSADRLPEQFCWAERVPVPHARRWALTSVVGAGSSAASASASLNSPNCPSGSFSEPPRVLRRFIRLSHPIVTGLENRISTIGFASATPGHADLRRKVAFVVMQPPRCRHGFAPIRLRLIPAASGLMTRRRRCPTVTQPSLPLRRHRRDRQRTVRSFTHGPPRGRRRPRGATHPARAHQLHGARMVSTEPEADAC